MKKNKPRVSIGLPVYNGERYLRNAIESNLSQTYKDFEMIISDNASTDGTKDICTEYASKDKRIRYYRFDTNLGAARNYNRVFELSEGEYFRWTTADDVCAPTHVEKCVETLDREPAVILCYPKTLLIDQYGNEIERFDDNLDLRHPSVIDRFSRFQRNVSLCNVIYGLIRSEILRKTNLMGGYISSDIVMIAELVLYGQFFEIPDFLFYRRFHPQALSSNKSIESQQNFFDPNTKGKISMSYYRHPYQNILSIIRSPIMFKDKITLCYMVVREMISNRKEMGKELKQMVVMLKSRYLKA